MDKKSEDEKDKSEVGLDELISLAEAANLFPELSQDALRRYAWSGRLRAKKIGRNYVTTKEWVKEYLASRHRGSRTDLATKEDEEDQS
jgi:hypothetical protein